MICIDSNILIYFAHPNKQWLRKWLSQQKSMSLGDAIVAGTALSKNLPLLTASTKDFRHIKSLDIVSLKEVKDN